VIEMATKKLTKTQTRKRLMEANKKLTTALSFFLANGNPAWKQCAEMADKCAKLANKLK
tara:strand:+ start:188 stop:364 length:177 start_codon:yes stop_codon:yes gene_type:complete